MFIFCQYSLQLSSLNPVLSILFIHFVSIGEGEEEGKALESVGFPLFFKFPFIDPCIRVFSCWAIKR